MSIRAIIFDMDGVLIDAKEWHFLALNEALKEFNLKPIEREQHLLMFDGLPTRQKLQKLYEVYGTPAVELHAAINARKQILTLEYGKRLCRPNRIHQELFQFLLKNHIRMACCSNSVRDTVEAFLGAASVTQYLEFFLSNQDVKEPKPSSEVYDKAINKLGLSPHEVLICEDNVNGIMSAKASGAHVLQIKDVNDLNIANVTAMIDATER